MNFLKLPAALFFIVVVIYSCTKTNDERAQLVTTNYERFIDSVVKTGSENGIKNWNSIDQEYNKKSTELQLEIDKLEDHTNWDKNINSAAAKYEQFRNKTIEEKIKREMSEDEIF